MSLLRVPHLTFVVPLLVIPAQAQESVPQPTQPAAKVAMSEIAPEVRAAVKKGIELMDAKQYKDASMAFLAAARKHPDNGQLRHLLGFAYYQDKQVGQAWLQFRQAVRLSPNYQPAARDFLALWSEFERRGVLNVGQTKEQLAKLLGKPDSSRVDGNQTIWEYGFMRLQFAENVLAAVLDPRGLDQTNRQPKDTVRIEFDDKTRWRLGYRAIDRWQSLTQYVPQNQTVQDFREMFTVQRLFQLSEKSDPQKTANDIQQNLKKQFPDAFFEILLATPEDVLFHWRDQGTKDRAPQHEFVRLIAGASDIHRLAYTQRVAQIPNEQAQTWVNLLRQAQLASVDAPSAVAP